MKLNRALAVLCALLAGCLAVHAIVIFDSTELSHYVPEKGVSSNGDILGGVAFSTPFHASAADIEFIMEFLGGDDPVNLGVYSLYAIMHRSTNSFAAYGINDPDPYAKVHATTTAAGSGTNWSIEPYHPLPVVEEGGANRWLMSLRVHFEFSEIAPAGTVMVASAGFPHDGNGNHLPGFVAANDSITNLPAGVRAPNFSFTRDFSAANRYDVSMIKIDLTPAVSTTPPLRLFYTRLGSELALSWTNTLTSGFLQEADLAVYPYQWTNIFTITGATNEVRVNTANGSRLFRLAVP